MASSPQPSPPSCLRRRGSKLSYAPDEEFCPATVAERDDDLGRDVLPGPLYCPQVSVLSSQALCRWRSVFSSACTFSASARLNRKLLGTSFSQTPQRLWRRV